ncbi:hypothetical protein [Yinghuangia seranimata]|uniref:hypothetical protein n=1 Tax=Yinghuangia seranimata TaxID=408067 RepID=UPI00248D28D6|nr:hypothetical protein [Yinghuangia seranimata]MDI2126116.1 hypothetical protein [Yinghuangia seranimata]
MDDRSLTVRRIPRWLLVLVALCATVQLGIALGVIGLGSDGSSPSPAKTAAAPAPHGAESGRPAAQGQRPDARRGEITHLLERRAAAVRAHDKAAYLATVDPRAAAFRDAQAAVFDNAAQVPFGAFDFELVTPDPFSLPSARRAELAAEQVFTAQVDVAYRLTDFDNAPVRSSQFLTFVLRDGTWYVAADSDGRQAGLKPGLQLWDLGPVNVLQDKTGIVLGIGNKNDLKSYQKDVETAVPDVAKVWGREWAGKAVVVVPGNQEQMARLLGAEPQKYARIAAVTTGERGASTESAAADRVIVNPDAFRELGPVERRVVMTHEITHVASRAFTRNWTPTWLSEGFADYVGYLNSGQTIRSAAPELRRDVRDGRVPQTLPSDQQFETTQDALPQAYEMGWLACRMVAERWGQAKLVALYREVGEAPPDGTGAPDQNTRMTGAFVQTLGISPDEFTKAWVQYVRAQVK